MDELIQAIEGRPGLPAYKAKGGADAAVDFLKEQLPDPTASQIDPLLEGNADAIADAVGDAADKLEGMSGD
ncbi:MAG: hypothetical protein ACLGHX_05465 [Acidimicrobiia bacterium]